MPDARPSPTQVLTTAVDGAGRRGAPRSGGDGRGGQRRVRRGPTPRGAGRHRHRQVPRLPRPGPAPRQAGRGRDGHAGPPAPARRARHPAAGRGRLRGPPRGRHVVRRAQGPLQLRLPAPHPRGHSPTTTRARWSTSPRAPLGKKVLALRAWAEKEAEGDGSGERDRAPRHTDREWRQVSVGHRDCLGAARCPFGEECFVELAREDAHRSHLIVTNHSLLAIDAVEGVPMIPEYDVVVIDEAHEVVARVTQAATDELLASDVDRASRRSRRYVDSTPGERHHPGRRPGRRRRRPRRGDRGVPAGPLRRGPRDARRRPGAGPRRGAGVPVGVPQGGRRRPRPTPAAPRPAGRCRRSSSPPSGWPPGRSPTCSG